jgi:hypothetical protein
MLLVHLRTPIQVSKKRSHPPCHHIELKLENKKQANATDGDNINTINQQQNDQIVIPMPNFFKRTSLLETGASTDTLRIDVLADDKVCGSVCLTPEDLRLLVSRMHNVRIFSTVIILGLTESIKSECRTSDRN